MPIYLFEHLKSGKIKEVFQSMNDKHEYVDENGIEWRRVFLSTNASVDTNIDPYSASDFSAKTANKRGTLGDLMDRSRELSEKRSNGNMSNDPVAKKYFENYSKKRNGKKHPKDPSNNAGFSGLI